MGGQSSREGARGGEGGGGTWGTDVLRPTCPSHLREDVGGAGAGAPGESPLELCSLCTETGGEPWCWRRWPGRECGERTPDRAGQRHGCPRSRAVTQLSSRVPRGRTWPRRGRSSAMIPRHRHAPDPPPRGGGGGLWIVGKVTVPTLRQIRQVVSPDTYRFLYVNRPPIQGCK